MREKGKEVISKKVNRVDKYLIIRIIVVAILLALYVGSIFVINNNKPLSPKEDEKKTSYEVAKILDVVSDNTTKDKNADNIKKGTMKLKIKILSGKYEGKELEIDNYLSAMYNVDVKKGDKVSIRIDVRNDGDIDVSIYNYYRVNSVFVVVLLFVAVLICIGGKKGAKALIGLIFTLINIVYILLPLTLKGVSPILVTLSVVLLSTMVSFVLLDGISRKTIISTIGTFVGILIGTLFAVFASKLMSVTTYQMEEAESLILTMSNTKLQVKNLFVCGIMISCMGAVMDVAMSIASAIEELRMVNSKLNAKELYKSGMNIGKDAMGTMANTLVLAFAGNSLNMLILISSYGVSFQQLINTDFIAIEIIKAISGSIGIVVAVPVVALIAAYVTLLVKKCKITENKLNNE